MNMNRLTEEKKTIFLLESNFHQVYARALLNVFASSLMKMCYGCAVDHPSQIHHECLMLSEEEKVQLCFDWICSRTWTKTPFYKFGIKMSTICKTFHPKSCQTIN